MLGMVDNEYRGIDGLIRVEGDELVFNKGGRLSRAVTGSTTWRISIASVREVVFKEPKASPGVLHLVIADAKTPKATVWSAVGEPWTITFRAGAQVKALRELHEFLQRCIQYNREHDINPITARRPYVDTAGSEQVNETKQRLLGDSLVRQPAPEVDPGEVVDLAKQHPAFAASWTDLDSITARLGRGEALRLLAHGMIGVSPTLIALTDRRVLFHSDNAISRKHDELPLAEIQVSWNSGVLTGGLVFRTINREVKVSALDDIAARAFIDGVGSKRAASTPTAATTPDVMEQLRQLGSLRDSGVLTEEEFQAKKAELLSRL